MKKFILTKNPYLLFSPFLVLYITLVLLFPTQGNIGDESYYLMFAHNLLSGFYSPPPPNIDLMYGPGYPLILVPFIVLGLPLISITLLNAVLYYFSIILLFKSLQQIVSYRMTLVLSIFWACYYHVYEHIYLIFSETITIFLVSLVIYSIVMAFSPVNYKKTNRYIVLAGLALGYIALTKVIFGYVILCLLTGTLIPYIINPEKINYRKGLFISLLALATTLPYLGYTYHLTGRIFYWGTSGGNNLYWMSSTHHREYGDWFGFHSLEKESFIYKESAMPGKVDSIKANHQNDYEELFKYVGVDRDDYYKKLAIDNIKSHPIKFLQNCFSNLGRLLFNYPSSYTLQRPINLLRLPLNGILFIILIFSSILSILNWFRINYQIRFMIFIALLYIGGSILGSAEIRMFTVIVPILLIWFAFIFEKTVQITWKNEYKI